MEQIYGGSIAVYSNENETPDTKTISDPGIRKLRSEANVEEI
jgi:hypothetical protein